MRVWRVTHRDHVAGAWTGEGARIRGGRWNSPGRTVVYASEHAALAVLEVLAYVRSQDLEMFRLLSATLDDDQIDTAPADGLGEGWDTYPHGAAARAVGDAWLAAGTSAALRVPSSLVPGYNVLLNPGHPGFAGLAVETGAQRIPFAQRAPSR